MNIVNNSINIKNKMKINSTGKIVSKLKQTISTRIYKRLIAIIMYC